jgi:predicted transcriptional regulator
MVKTVATQLFLICAVAAALNLEGIISAYKPFRSNVLSPLADLALTDKEALDKISTRINQLLGVPLDQKDFWTKIVAKETTYDAPEVSSEDIKAVLEKAFEVLQDLTPQLRKEKQSLTGDATSQKAALSAAAKATLTAKAGELKSLLHEFIKARFRSDFRNLLKYPTPDMKLVGDTAGLSSLRALLNQAAETAYNQQDLDFDLDPSFVKGLGDEIRDSLAALEKFAFELTELLLFFTYGAEKMRTEAEHMFFAIQYHTAVSDERRLSRMDVILKMLVYFGKSGNQSSKINSIFELFRGYYKSSINFSYLGEDVDSAVFDNPDFQPLFRVVVRNFLTFVNDQASPREAYAFAVKLLASHQTVSMNHLRPYLEELKKTADFPVIPAEKSEASKAQYLKIISYLIVLNYDEVNQDWWRGALAIVDNLLTVDATTLKVLAFLSIEMDFNITPYTVDTAKFLDAHFEAIIAFLAAEGSKIVEFKNSYPDFDKFLDTYAATNKAAKPFYLRSKIQNIFASNDKLPFETKFENFASEEEFKILNVHPPKPDPKNLENPVLGPLPTHPKLSITAWNAWAKEEANKVKLSETNKDPVLYKSKATLKAQREGKHLQRLMNGSSIDTILFPHLKVGITEKAVEQATVETPIAHTFAVSFNVNDAATTLNLKEKAPTENKITSDSGISKEESPVENKLNEQELEQLASKLSRQNSIIPNPALEEMIEVQIEETRKSDEIQRQITQVLEDAQEEADKEAEKEPEEISSGEKKEPETFEHHNVDVNEEVDTIGPLPELKRHQGAIYGNIESEEKALVNPIHNFLTPKERALLEQPNLEEALNELNELVDEDGQVTTFVMVKLIPKKSDCFESLFA